MNNKLHIIGDLINNAYGRARTAFTDKNLAGYQALAKSQSDLGVDFLDVNIDGTRLIQVRLEEMLAFLPELIPALQEVTRVPLCMDNPSIDFQKVALKHYDRKKSGAPILNSVAASRVRLEEFVELVAEYDTNVVVMASEKFADGGSAQCMDPQDVYTTAKYFADLLRTKAGRKNEHLIFDTGLAPVGADTYGLVNIGLDAMRLIRKDPDLAGVHITCGLSNFAWGTPKEIRHVLEKAYLTIGMDAGLDFAIANPEKSRGPLPAEHPLVGKLRGALEQGRPAEGESQEMAGFRQAEAVMKIWSEGAPAE
jgi:5-methyltetrahydrofolate corrinoid/iron sulfur protein methyltransferase